MNTLSELALALSNYANCATTVQHQVSSNAPIANPTFTGTVNGITKAMVGLGNLDNTADARKPIATATQGALDLKAPLASPTFTGTVSGVTKAIVGLGKIGRASGRDRGLVRV